MKHKTKRDRERETRELLLRQEQDEADRKLGAAVREAVYGWHEGHFSDDIADLSNCFPHTAALVRTIAAALREEGPR